MISKIRPANLKISTKVALSFVVLVLLQGTVTLITLSVIISRSQNEAFAAQMSRTVSGIEGYLSEVLDEQMINANLLSGQAKVIDYTEFRLRNLLQRELSVYRSSLQVDSVSVFVPPYTALATAGDGLVRGVVMEDRLAEAFAGDDAFFLASGVRNAKLTVLTPIEREEEIIGVLALSRNLDADFVDRLQTFTNTRIILSFEGLTVSGAELEQAVAERVVEAHPEPGPGTETRQVDEYLVGTISMAGFGEPRGMIYCLLDTTDYRRLITHYNSISIVFTLLILTVALFTGIAFYRVTFARPFHHLLEGVHGIAEGNLQYRFEAQADDEFGVLARAFDSMRVNLINREQELVQLSLYNALILDNIGAGIVTVNLEREITTVNPAGARILGLDPGGAVGTPLCRQTLPGPLFDAVEAGLSDGAYGNSREVSISHDGDERTLSMSTSPLMSKEDDQIGVIAIFEDITKVKRLEERLAISSRLAALGEMAAGVAHQIRNPLGVMKVSAEMLRDDYEVTERTTTYDRITHMMINEIDTLSLVIRNLLDFARPPELQPQLCSVADVVANALDSLPLDKYPELTVRTAGLEEAGEYEMDRSLMEQVLANLVLNAMQASPPDGAVEIRCTRTNGRLEIDVQDWGAGFDEATRRRIFNPFFTTKSNGTGLGLSIGHRIVEQHHGTMDVASEPGAGSTFRIIL